MVQKTVMENYKLITLIDLFAEGSRAFTIPDYQRGYSWEESQLVDLSTDIDVLMDVSHMHYTGTIVASNSNKKDGNVELYDVVDGQQRLISLIILLSILWRSRKLEKKIKDELYRLFLCVGSEDGNTIRKFSLSSDFDVFFWEIVKEGTVGAKEEATKSHVNIKNAVNFFIKWLENTKYEHAYIYHKITKQLGFLFYVPSNDSEVGIMFEVINNRGKALSELEKIKNYLIYYSVKKKAKDLKKKVKETWGTILSNLGLPSV